MKKVFTLITIYLLIQGCASTQPTAIPQPKPPPAPAPEITQPIPAPKSTQDVYALLNARHDEWKGTPYQMGGLSEQGIDCSGFVHLTFRELFGLDIPRSTELLADIGTEVTQSNLKAGDLVFYKTTATVRHVGIYMREGQFLHASTSRGVIISKMDNVYWAPRYWKSVRVRQKLLKN